MALATKRLLAEELKALLKKKTLEKITIKELTAGCGVNRQTFYYNFQDIYDLLEWIFEEEGARLQKKTEEMEDWQDKLRAVIQELSQEDTRRLVLNAFYSVNPIQADQFMQNFFRPIIADVVLQRTKEFELSEQNRDFMIRVYVMFFVDLVMRWIKSGLEIGDMSADIDKMMYIMSGSGQYIAQALQEYDHNGREPLFPAR